MRGSLCVRLQVVRGRGGAPPGPDGRVPPEPAAAAVTDVGLVLVREAAKELLQRGERGRDRRAPACGVAATRGEAPG